MERKIKSMHLDLDSRSFRKYAQQAVEWIAHYLNHMDKYPVLAQSKPNDIKRQLPQSPPVKPESFDKILADFTNIIVPGITHWNHPRFFAYFSITGSCPGIIGEMLCGALNVNAMLWKTSPAATELEEVVLDWLRQMLGLPHVFDGVINDTASVSSLCAMTAAREFADLDIRAKGIAGRKNLAPMRVYTSEEAHSSIEKAAIVLGFGQQGVRKISTDEAYRMDAQALHRAIQQDISAGLKPICVIATIGTTSTTSVDPVPRIAEICQQHRIWLHIDAAYGGAAALVPEMRSLFTGWEKADSIVVNPHKWLFTPIDCSVLYCKKPEVLRQAFSLTPEYLRTPVAGKVKNLMDYGISLGRRFRALKLWMIIRSFGSEGIINAIKEHISFAQKLAQMIEAHPDFELLAPVPFSTLVFRFHPHKISKSRHNKSEIDQQNEKLLEAINQTGEVFLSHTKVRGRFGLRLAIGNLKTTWKDVLLTWEIIQQRANSLS